MQRFVSDAKWKDENLMGKYRNMVNEDLGDQDGALIFDESGFVKKGNDSVGVAKQYCGSIGKGPIEYEFSKRRVILSKDGLPDRTDWLIIKRTIGDNPEYSYYISNAPLSTRLKTFVWLSGLRWAIEQCFEETKSELGMDHYEVRKYRGWNHHILTCIL